MKRKRKSKVKENPSLNSSKKMKTRSSSSLNERSTLDETSNDEALREYLKKQFETCAVEQDEQVIKTFRHHAINNLNGKSLQHLKILKSE